MKTIKFLIIGTILFMASAGQSQFSMSINLPAPPLWGPVGFTTVRYYYLPDVEAYYDVQSRMFIYSSSGIWVHRAGLPSRYRDYDLYGGYKVVMSDYHGTTPYVNFKQHKLKYYKGYHGGKQRTNGERPGTGNSGGKHNKGDDHYKQQGGNDHGGNGNHGNDQGKSQGNGKNKGNDHGHGEGNGKKK